MYSRLRDIYVFTSLIKCSFILISSFYSHILIDFCCATSKWILEGFYLHPPWMNVVFNVEVILIRPVGQ